METASLGLRTSQQLLCETWKEVVVVGCVFGVGGEGEHCTNLTGGVPGLGPLHQSTNGTSPWDTMAAVLTGSRGGRVWDQTDLRIRWRKEL